MTNLITSREIISRLNELKEVLAKEEILLNLFFTKFSVHFLQKHRSGFINVTIGPATTSNNLVVSCRQNVLVLMITELTMIEVISRFVTSNVFVVLHKFYVSVSTKSIYDLQVNMDSDYNAFSRSQTNTDLVIQREVEINNSVKRRLNLYQILRRGLLIYRLHNLIQSHVFLVNRHYSRLRRVDYTNIRDFAESQNYHHCSNNNINR